MNALLPPRHVFVLLLAVLCAAWFATAAVAGDASPDASTLILQANAFYGLVADRSRMIQVSLVCVALGCALIWWYK